MPSPRKRLDLKRSATKNEITPVIQMKADRGKMSSICWEKYCQGESTTSRPSALMLRISCTNGQWLAMFQSKFGRKIEKRRQSAEPHPFVQKKSTLTGQQQSDDNGEAEHGDRILSPAGRFRRLRRTTASILVRRVSRRGSRSRRQPIQSSTSRSQLLVSRLPPGQIDGSNQNREGAERDCKSLAAQFAGNHARQYG